jgi:uncharacterized protein DUF4058
MSLLDHFRPPLYPMRHWESFHAFWCTAIAGHLNQAVLPAGYFAETQIHIGGRVEVDVGTLEAGGRSEEANGPVATLTAPAWAPPAPPLIMSSVFPDEVEVQVRGGLTGAHLVAAIELVSPGNKDRPETRLAFAVKCASYLQAGIGLVVVDVVTERLANLHDFLVELLRQAPSFRFPSETLLYAVAYRPVRTEATGDQIEMWPTALALGQPLPVLPLALRGGPTLPLDLETTYTEARERSRL